MRGQIHGQATYGHYSNSRPPSLPFRIKSAIEGRMLRKLFRAQRRGVAVLDVGCGDGRLLDNIRCHTTDAGALEGIEISQVSAGQALSKGYPVHIGTVSDYVKAPASFVLFL